MWNRLKTIATLTAVLTVATPALSTAQSSTTSGENTYTWFGELVSFDTAARKLTVKARCAYPDTLDAARQLKPGSSVWIKWSGFRDSSDAVWQIMSADSSKKIGDDLVMPAELVALDSSHVTLRIPVPDTNLQNLGSVKPGEFVTVTSRHRPSTDADAIVAVRPYVVTTTT